MVKGGCFTATQSTYCRMNPLAGMHYSVCSGSCATAIALHPVKILHRRHRRLSTFGGKGVSSGSHHNIFWPPGSVLSLFDAPTFTFGWGLGICDERATSGIDGARYMHVCDGPVIISMQQFIALLFLFSHWDVTCVCKKSCAPFFFSLLPCSSRSPYKYVQLER